MVLPPPAADPGAAQARAWLGKLIQPLELSRGGILLCLRDAIPTQLGPVVRALSGAPPWADGAEVLEVCLRATQVLDVPPGSRVLLRVRTEDLDWLNVARPLFAERELRTILWADAAAMKGLIERAVDFFDWVSRTVSVPAKPVPDFAVDGMKAALAARAELAWSGDGLPETLEAAGVDATVELHVEEPYLSLIEALRDDDRLPLVAGIRSERDLWRVRMARVQAGHERGWVAREPAVELGNLWRLHAEQADWDEASEHLRAAGWRRPGLTAAWLDLQPERIAKAVQHVNSPPRELLAAPPTRTASKQSRALGLMQALRNLDDELPSSKLIEEADRAGFPEVVASLTLARWNDGEQDVDGEQLIELLSNDGDIETARQIATEWRRRTGDPAAARWQRELRLVEDVPLDSIQAGAGDLELLQRWGGGDRRAGSKLVERYYPGLRNYFLARVGDDAAVDLIQETFMRLVDARDRFTGRSTVRSFLFAIARVVLQEELRRSHRSRVDLSSSFDSIADGGETYSSLLARNDEQRRLLEALRHIPLELHDLLELHYFHGLTQAELAELFEVPSKVIESRLALARRQLARACEALAEPRHHEPLDLEAGLRAVGALLDPKPKS